MFRWFWLSVGALIRGFRSRQNLLLENLALRQQLTVGKREHPKPKLRVLDMLFWVTSPRTTCVEPVRSCATIAAVS